MDPLDTGELYLASLSISMCWRSHLSFPVQNSFLPPMSSLGTPLSEEELSHPALSSLPGTLLLPGYAQSLPLFLPPFTNTLRTFLAEKSPSSVLLPSPTDVFSLYLLLLRKFSKREIIRFFYHFLQVLFMPLGFLTLQICHQEHPQWPFLIGRR